MTSRSTARLEGADAQGMWGFLILSLAKIWLDRQWPGSLSAVLVSYAYTAWFLFWFGSRVWIGYRRRRPHWTGESWRRYARLACMPFIAIVLLFTELYLFNVKGSRIVFGTAQSGLRTIWVLIDLALIAFGGIGLALAVDWMRKGEPSEPFTRTRWFRRGGVSAISD